MDETLEATVDRIFAPWEALEGPGATLAVFREGETVLCRSGGAASIEHRVPNGRDTVFYIASTSKQFVAALTAMLVLEGRVDLDAPVTEYLPELYAFDPPVRVRHLVHHTSGLRDKYALGSIGRLPDEVVATDEGSLRLLAGQRTLNFPPGSRHMYSNSGYFLLAQITERVTGQRFGDVARERIFEPLGMASSTFRHDTTEVIPHRASGYVRGADSRWHVAEYTWNSLGPGGLVTTVDDLSRWSRALMTGQVGPEGTAALMQEVEPLADGTPCSYAFGLSVEERAGVRVLSHGGGVPGFSAEMIHVPAQQLTIACLANSSAVGAGALAHAVLDRLLPAAAPPAATSAGAARPTAPVRPGRYLSVEETSLLTLSEEAGAWRLQVGPTTIELAADGGALRAPSGLAVTIEDGQLLVRQGAGAEPLLRCRAVEVSGLADPQELAGTYESEELGISLRLAVGGDGATLAWPFGPPARLTAAGPDLLLATAPGGAALPVRVLRDPDGRAAALRISTDRALGTQFARR